MFTGCCSARHPLPATYQNPRLPEGKPKPLYLHRKLRYSEPLLPARKVSYQRRDLFISHVPDASQGPTLQAGLPEERPSRTCYVNSFLHMSPLLLTTPGFPVATGVTLFCASRKASLRGLHVCPSQSDHSILSTFFSSSYGSHTALLAEHLVRPWPGLAPA